MVGAGSSCNVSGRGVLFAVVWRGGAHDVGQEVGRREMEISIALTAQKLEGNRTFQDDGESVREVKRVCERLCEWVCVIARECVKGCVSGCVL
jgi:hypothetical protein